MDYLNASVGPANMELLHGCCREAQQADFVAFGLQGLQSSLSEPLRPMMVTLLEEIRRSGRLLRDLADKAQLHVSRVPVMLNYLNIIMPCFSKSLKDITSYYENKAISRENRWRKMYHEMGKEASNLPLPQRFMLYNHFLDQLGHLLARSPDFDPNTLELLQTQILKLRDKRGIPPPAAQSSLVVIPPTSLVLPYTPERPIHWAEDIFSRPLASRTPLKHLKPSETFRPFSAVGELHMPRNLQTLFKRPFDNDRISVTVFLDTSDNSAYLFARSLHFGTPWFSLKGAHELCISRESAALVLKRWSASMQRSTPWAVLYFLTWEEMVLFHCAFVALKRNSARSFDLHPDEFRLEGERRLFQARINDDGYEHSLIVYRDAETRGLRLHAAVWDGDLRRCPVWTAFVTHQSQRSHPAWLSRRGRRRVLLSDVQLYVFCADYRQETMRRHSSKGGGGGGAFELNFQSEEAAARFKEVFDPFMSVASSEATGAEGGGGGGGGEGGGG